MLVTSAVRRTRLSGSSASSLPKANPKASSGLCKAQFSRKRSEEEATTVLKSGFPQGFHEAAFTGKDEVVGEQHCQFLEAWYGLGTLSTPTSRKAWQTAFPNLGSSSVNAVLKKISGAKSGERMPPIGEEAVGGFEPSPAKGGATC